jgi:hypothetical protein
MRSLNWFWQPAIPYNWIHGEEIQRTRNDIQCDGCRYSASLWLLFEVATVPGRIHPDQQPDEHKDAENSATPHAALHPCLRRGNRRAALVYPAGNFGKPSGSDD